jgi:hypothetical protein
MRRKGFVTRRRHAIAVLLTLAIASTACTRSEGDSETGTGEPAEDTTGSEPGAGGRLDEGAFGDLENVCGEGEGGGATETGLTADEIRLGTITDKGAAERAGLTQEMYDAAVAFAAWCNEHGGIQGREVVIDDLDAKLFDYGQRIAEACQEDFALVGGGGVFDSQAVQERIDCGLPNIAGYTVTGQARVAALQVQPVPNPIQQYQAAPYRWLGDADPEARNYGIMWVNLDGPATVHAQTVDAVEAMGYDVVFDEQYRPLGETGWRGFVDRMREAEVEVFEIVGEPENLVQLQGAMQTAGWYPDYTVLQANYYDQKYEEEGASTVSETTYIRSAFPLFDMGDQVPAMQDYLDLMERYNPDGKVALLGAQSLSAFLLFATAANECGADLSRACVLEKAAAVEGWTAGGLHAAQQPGNETAAECNLMIHVTPDGFEHEDELAPPTEGIYNCHPDNVIELDGDYGVPAPDA